MHTITAYDRREALSTDELVRLRSALVGEVERYRLAIRGYSPEKMQDHGAPFLSKLEHRVDEVSRILTSRDGDPGEGTAAAAGQNETLAVTLAVD